MCTNLHTADQTHYPGIAIDRKRFLLINIYYWYWHNNNFHWLFFATEFAFALTVGSLVDQGA